MRVQRHTIGSVRYDKRRRTWNYLWYDGATRRSKRLGTRQDFPTKAAAWKEVERLDVSASKSATGTPTLTVAEIVGCYREEKMPERVDTRRSYEVWLTNYILPKWGSCRLDQVQARPVEMWLGTLSLAPKSKAHIRGLFRLLWDYAMWRGDTPTQRNPMELVTVRGATKRQRQPRSLTVDEFRGFVQHLSQPFSTLALLCCCLGLRISEALALRWADIDWLNGKLTVERGIVCQQVDTVKTPASRKQLVISGELLGAFADLEARGPILCPE